MAIYIGIDGGGSNLRIAAVDESLNVIAQVTRGAANPSGIGRETSAALIQEAIREVLGMISPLSDAQPHPQPLSVGEGSSSVPTEIKAVGIGVAGASPVYADDWLRETVGAVLPGVPVATATDVEIALVGANGERKGIIIVAGTGSVAFGVNEAGESLQVGGWGYLLGDEGSGYAIGMLALRTLTQWWDTRAAKYEKFAARIMEHLQLTRAQDLIPWLYGQPPSPSRVADLAKLVLAAAEEGDSSADAILLEAAAGLSGLYSDIVRRLAFSSARVAFGGGLLTSDNAYTRKVCKLFRLEALPEPQYPPVIGAALLAKITDG